MAGYLTSSLPQPDGVHLDCASAHPTAEAPALLEWAERAFAGAALLSALPLLLVAAVAVFALSGLPPLIAHRRVGRHGRPLALLKLRSMWPSTRDARRRRRGAFRVELIDGAAVPLDKQAPDARITSSFARFCRRYSIDELPQLWHVVRGEMSLVGPRPMTAEELRQWYGAEAGAIVQWKPGLTGLWQVSGRNSLTYPERRELDLYLVSHWSTALYLRILWATVPRVLSGENAS